MTRAVAAGVLVAVALAATGCGEPTTDDYCEQLAEDREEIAGMVSSTSPTALLGGLETLEELAGQAPRDLADEWDTFLRAVRGLDEAIEEAGLDRSDLDADEPLQGLDAEQQELLRSAAQRLQSEDVVAAADGIETQARDVCKVNLGL